MSPGASFQIRHFVLQSRWLLSSWVRASFTPVSCLSWPAMFSSISSMSSTSPYAWFVVSCILQFFCHEFVHLSFNIPLKTCRNLRDLFSVPPAVPPSPRSWLHSPPCGLTPGFVFSASSILSRWDFACLFRFLVRNSFVTLIPLS